MRSRRSTGTKCASDRRDRDILRRVLAYARKVLKWEAPLEAIRDGRKRPQIGTRRIVRSAVVMFLCRLGSLNALGQSKGSRFWRSWLGAALPSPDTVGRVAGLIDPEQVRALHRALYAELKRGKALAPPQHGLMAAILDGHESHATYRRRCSGCLERKVRTAKGEERLNA